MRAFRFDGASARLVGDLPAPTPGPNEALVRVRRVGLGRLDALLASGVLGGSIRFAGTLGREALGVVERLGPSSEAVVTSAVRRPQAGQRVVVSPHVVCARCECCRAGLSIHCRHRTTMGLAGRDGLLSEFVCVPLSSLTPVPARLDDAAAILAYELAETVHVPSAAHADGKPFVSVLGDSCVALLCAQVLGRLNKSARLLYTQPDRADVVGKWGVRNRPLAEAGRRQDQDVVVDCTVDLAAAGARSALGFVRPRGTIVIKSLLAPVPIGADGVSCAASGPGIDATTIAASGLQVVGCREGTLAEALMCLERGDADVSAIPVRRFRFDDAAAALSAAGESAVLKVVVEL